ncbi:hypothetical protein OEZ86_007162 [Tetradesmus obliquus]|nr:hypothetical protein OEZ86_007162 [Tetradesmus obliquus]
MSSAEQKASTTPAGTPSGKWAVCTTIFEPSQAIVRAVALSGWSVVVVGDKSGAAFNLTAPNLVFLDVTAQQQMADAYGGFTALLPWKHFGRKNIGYLYAITHGAHTIWDFDDDNILKQGIEPALPSRKVFHVAVDNSSCEAFNPYPYMGGPAYADPSMPQSWPRGFPLQLIRKPCSATLLSGDASNVAVVQSLADHDPDVDGIYRLTRGVPFEFHPDSDTTVVLPCGVLAPWNAQLRSPHNYLADMQAEEDLYYKSGQLVTFLRQWAGSASTLPGRAEELMIELYERGYLGLQDVQLTQQWLLALAHAGYQFPAIQSAPSPAAAAAAAAVLPQKSTSKFKAARPNIKVTAGPAAAPTRSVRGAVRGEKWAVFTSARAPTAAIKAVAELDGWQVVVVADSATPDTWSWPNVTFLSLQQQQELGYDILQHIPPDDHA